jgi:hypothetical protein
MHLSLGTLKVEIGERAKSSSLKPPYTLKLLLSLERATEGENHQKGRDKNYHGLPYYILYENLPIYEVHPGGPGPISNNSNASTNYSRFATPR